MNHINNQTQINGILSSLLQKIRINKALPYIRSNRVLDVGCSIGEILRYLPNDIDYIGIEGNPTYFKNAQARNPNHTFINLYLDGHNSADLDIPERDTIIMLAILEHLNQPIETLINLRRYLSKEGNIVITTPSNFGELFLKIGSKFRIFSSEIDEHKNHFSKKELISICKEAGAKIVYYSTFEFGMNHLIVLE